MIIGLSSPEIAAEDVAGFKRQMRAEAAARRHAASSEAASHAACDRFLQTVAVPDGAVVSGFWPMGDEIDVRPLLLALADAGHAIGLPVVVKRAHPLTFRRWVPGQALVSGGFGVSTPGPECEEVEPDLSITPLLAFDRAGYRLGYGGGFYDRTIALLRAKKPFLAVGFALAAQEVEAIPRDAFDERLDWIVTDRFALRFESGRHG